MAVFLILYERTRFFSTVPPVYFSFELVLPVNEGGECERGEAQKTPRPGSRGVSEKGRTTPLDLEGLEFARFGVRQSIYETAGNFCTSDNGKKGWKT